MADDVKATPPAPDVFEQEEKDSYPLQMILINLEKITLGDLVIFE